MAKTARTRKREGFLADYNKLSETYWQQPDRAAGRAGLLSGLSPEGFPVLIKIWPRRKGNPDIELEEIWRHELRQLHRLAGFPGAFETIAPLRQAGLDENGFYLVLDPGQRRPLHVVLEHAPASHWLNQPRLTSNRVRIWRNLVLICQGLETLHAQGLLHRNIDEWAVLTAGIEQADFQLTGFEWSMRVTSSHSAKLSRGKKSDNQNYSFRHDWLMLGLLAARLLKVDVNRLLDLRIAPSEIAEHITTSEAKLLRAVVHDEAGTRLSGNLVADRITEVLRTLNAEVASLDPKFHIAFRLGSGTPLSGRIREASGNEIETDDIDAQLEFLRSDLAEEPLLMALKAWTASDAPRLVLRGHQIRYVIREYVHPKANSIPTWEFAYCDSVEVHAPAPVNILGQLILDAKSLELMTISSAADRFPRLRGKLSTWDELSRNLLQKTVTRSKKDIVHRALTLTQFLDVLYAAADVYPVEIIKSGISDQTQEGDAVLRLRTRSDLDRNALSDALDLRKPSIRLESALLEDAVRKEGWILTGSRSLGERALSDTEWQFQKVEENQGSPKIFVFTGPSYIPVISDAFLVPAGSVGRDVQFRRRLKALRALKEHVELLNMLTDPRQRILDSHDKLIMDDAFSALDGPKQTALRQLTATIPLYLVQGPPGAGKTRLVRDLVRRRFEDEPTTRLLLTAQSNSAVDHLLDELAACLEKDLQSGPLVIRCRSREESEIKKSPFEIGVQSAEIVRELIKSELADKAAPHLQRRLAQLASAVNVELDGFDHAPSTSSTPSHILRAFEGLIVRAANVVFATTNSAELERLVDEKGQFDWSIVEEAGKATGSELLSPLLLSHRRLMIGDHKQLPPFGSDKMKELLEAPESVKHALLIGEEFIGRALRDPTTEEILDEIEEDDGDFAALCSEALVMLTLFESIIEKEFARQKKSQSGRPIATRLTAQHRMHPIIAELVSRCFYDREIETDPDRRRFFETTKAPFVSSDVNRLPDKPIVVIDMPYIQSTVGVALADCLPRWHNPDEVSAVIETLGLLRATTGSAPSLTVLSPYNQQVKRINQAVEDVWSSRLGHMDEFTLAHKSGVVCGTVDSFQGSEADVVIVSLVRNNQHVSPRSALGFLSDFRRMNVLLSRGRWKLILIGSTKFLETIVEAARGTENEAELAFLKRLLVALAEWEADGSIERVPYSKLMGLSS